MRIAFDIDGVLADYNSVFLERLALTSKRRLFPQGYVPQEWHYGHALGYTQEEIDRAQQSVCEDASFWRMLPQLPGAQTLRQCGRFFQRDIDAYFITDRKGYLAKDQTEQWLMHALDIDSPTVLISPHKGSLCAALQIECYIDDKVDNIEGCMNISPSTRSYCLVQPWNKMDRRLMDMQTTKSVEDFLRNEGLWED